MTPDEFDYYLAQYLYETSPEERYNERRSQGFSHKYTSFGKIELGNFEPGRDMNTDMCSDAYGCTGRKCVSESEYHSKTGRIDDNEVINEWLEKKIVELDQYKEELGEELFNKIIRDDDSYDRDKMRQECVKHYTHAM